jgi:membrane fusion protein, macrolide-specific efflux system
MRREAASLIAVARSAWFRGLAVFVLAAVAWGGYRMLFPPPVPQPQPDAEVVLGDIAQTVRAAGVLQAKTKVDVGAQVSGQVKTLHVQLGQKVKKGDVVVSLDPELARNEVARSQAALLQQRALLDALEVDLTTARRELDRQRRLLAGQATAAVDLELAESAAAKREADLRGQRAVMSRLQADLAQAQVRLGYTRITAPMDGTVVSIPVQVGQTVIAVQITPVMLTIADLDTITVRARVPESEIQSVRAGQPAGFLTPSNDGQRYEGKVFVVQPVPERSGNVMFYNALFDVDNRAGQLLSDMTVQVDIETGQAKGVPVVPMVALGERRKDGRYAVMRPGGDGKPEAHWVRTGLQDGVRVQVLDGLKAGDKVLLAPAPATPA